MKQLSQAELACRGSTEETIPLTELNSNDFLTVDIADDGAIMVSGDVDISAGPVLEAKLLQHDGAEPMVVDLTKVTFMDSSGLRSLLAASHRARQHGSKVVLRNVGPEVWRLLEITKTASHFVVESRRS
jgi:anti-anti-sigma factor